VHSERAAFGQRGRAKGAMTDYFLSDFDGCCLNCPEEERKIICGNGMWCDRCLCLKGCGYYQRDLDSDRGYCGIRKQLLDNLGLDYLQNPEEVRSWLKQLKVEGISIPRAVVEIVKDDRRTKLSLEARLSNLEEGQDEKRRAYREGC